MIVVLCGMSDFAIVVLCELRIILDTMVDQIAIQRYLERNPTCNFPRPRG